jgi:hypothetical protein
MRRRSRTLSALVAAGTLFAMASDGNAASQLFKCVEGGRTVYQQQACPVSAQTEPTASSPRGIAKADAAPTSASAAVSNRLKPVSLAASSAPAKPR